MRKSWIVVASLLLGCGSNPPPKAEEPTAAPASTPTAPAAEAPAKKSEGPSADIFAAPAAPASDEGPAIPLEPLKITIAKKDDRAIELKPDGSVAMKDGTLVAKVARNEVQLPDGEWVVRLQRDGTVQTRTKKKDPKSGEGWAEATAGRLNEKNELAFEKGGKAWIEDGGAIKLQGKAGPDARLDGGYQSRRAGILIFLAAMNGTVSVTSPPAKK